MSPLLFWKRLFAQQLSFLLKEKVDAREILIPPDPAMGDLSYPCFRLAKARGISPAALAKTLTDEWPDTLAEFSRVSAEGPYVNATLETKRAMARVIEDVEREGERFGFAEPSSAGEIVFEYANPNTHKEIHIGHLRNFVLGASLARILSAAGRDMVPVSYINDVGNNVAKCLWQFVRQSGADVKALTDEQAHDILHRTPAGNHNGHFLGQMYTEATRALEERPEWKEEVSFAQARLEQHDEAWEHLWRETRRWCVEELHAIFQELGVRIERQYFESDLIDRSMVIVDELVAKGLAKESDGALVVDLEEEGLGVALVRKTDGTLLYASKDLALGELKVAEYPDMNESAVLVDHRQSLYFKQLFAMLRKMGFTQKFRMVGFDIVTLKEGVMSSRKGNIITYQAFRDAVVAYAREEVIKRHLDWPEGKVKYAAWAIAMAGIKFGMLKQDNDRPIIFEPSQQLSFDGATGPYCQYAATRMGAIIKKSNHASHITHHAPTTTDHQAQIADDVSQKRLVLVMALLPDRVREAGEQFRSSVIAQWCLDMAQAVNAFYRDAPVLDAPPEEREERLRLVAASRQALQNGLALLGIPAPEEM